MCYIIQKYNIEYLKKKTYLVAPSPRQKIWNCPSVSYVNYKTEINVFELSDDCDKNQIINFTILFFYMIGLIKYPFKFNFNAYRLQ